eukprot:6204175-Pleurochrysis_carterae.AAC.2
MSEGERHGRLAERPRCACAQRGLVCACPIGMNIHNIRQSVEPVKPSDITAYNIYNGLQELDSGLVVGGKWRSLGAPPPDGIEEKETTARDLNYDATTKLETRLRQVSRQPRAHGNMRLRTTATGRAPAKSSAIFLRN